MENPFVFKKLAISGPGQLSISPHNSKIKQSKLFLLKETRNPFFFEANVSGDSDISFNLLQLSVIVILIPSNSEYNTFLMQKLQ